MIKNKKILAIIPARKDSKELKNKNIKNFKGKPLICWTIEAAKKSRLIDQILVSTNSERILKISNKYKDIICSKRPEKLSTDKSELMDTILFELKKFKTFDVVVLLQPTSPLRTYKDIDKGLSLMMRLGGSSCVIFRSIKYNTSNFYTINSKNKIKSFVNKKRKTTNRQNYKKFYYPSGDLYISRVNILKKEKSFIEKNTIPFLINSKNSVDIDNIIDFKIAELVSGEKK
jgi:CMP-N,N'-diacetyllegionaminic acid synthase